MIQKKTSVYQHFMQLYYVIFINTSKYFHQVTSFHIILKRFNVFLLVHYVSCQFTTEALQQNYLHVTHFIISSPAGSHQFTDKFLCCDRYRGQQSSRGRLSLSLQIRMAPWIGSVTSTCVLIAHTSDFLVLQIKPKILHMVSRLPPSALHSYLNVYS